MTRTAPLLLLVAALCAAPASGDDTDIYVDPVRPATAEPLVMFSLDYRPNLAARAPASVAEYFRAQGLGADVAALEAIDGRLVLFDTLILSLKLVLAELRGVKVGLMLSHADGGPAGDQGAAPAPRDRGSNGGAILLGFRSLDEAGTREAFQQRLLALRRLKAGSASTDHPYQGAELFFELFRYLTGQDVYNGRNGWADFDQPRDDADNMRCDAADAALRPACWDPAILAGSPPRYRTPLASVDACARIYTVNFMFQVSQKDADTALWTTARADGGVGRTQAPHQNAAFGELLAFLNGADLADGQWGSASDLAGRQNVTSFFFGPQDTPAFHAYAQSGGTGRALPLAADPAQLVEALRGVLRQILSVSTSFVAASVPVNVFNRAALSDNLYFALFEPDAGPAWDGNLKKLKLALDDTGVPFIADARGQPAIAPLDGRIRDDALTFWTDAIDPELRAGDVNGDGETEPPRLNPDAPADPAGVTPSRDGRRVARGGAGQKIPGFRDDAGGPGESNAAGRRQLFYLSGATQLAALDASPAVAQDLGAALLGTADAAAQLDLLRHVRGLDVRDSDADGDRTEARPWLMGDPLHSRPLPINYGAATLTRGTTTEAWSESNPAIFIALAGNDGLLRLIRNTAADGTESGEEVWAFLPPEGVRVQQRLLDGTLGGPGEAPHPYAFDGEPTALVVDRNGNGTIEAGTDRVIIYAGLRRGGRAYYALDVTDPYAPRFLWRIGNDGRRVAGETQMRDPAAYAELALAFSRPRVGAVLAGRDGGGTPRRRLALFLGGGYHGGPAVSGARPGKDDRGPGRDDPAGNALFVLDALTGELIWKAVGGAITDVETDPATRTFRHAALRDGVASTLAVVDTDGDGLHDRLLAGDTGGNLWRADLGGDRDGDGELFDDWRLTRLACLGRHGGGDECAPLAGKADDRRFFHEPDLVQARDAQGRRYDAVVIGSGDRENPLDRDPAGGRGGTAPLNRFYVVRDPNVGAGSARSDLDRTNAGATTGLTDVTDACLNDAPCELGPNGWRIDLRDRGEKVLSAPLTLAHTIWFTSYVPPPAAGTPGHCGPGEGSGFLYSLKLDDGAPARDADPADATAGSAGDRRSALLTPGIPSQVVFLGAAAALAGAAAPPAGAGCTVKLLAGTQLLDAPGCPRFRTSWQRVEP